MTYKEACDFIENIGRFSVKNSNEHTRLLLARLGNPDQRFPSIHVAGTNGKGSVCAYVAGVMEMSGRKTALFTSPHLMRINERMKINGRDISDGDFARICGKVERVCREAGRDGLPHPSYFEFLFIMAMVYFAEQRVDIAVIETGLGGRLDATNALLQPYLTVITSISFDHMQYLGNTIPEIAAEKAGIIKAGTPLAYDAGNPAAAAVIAAKAKEKGVKSAALLPEDYRWQREGGGCLAFSTSFRYDERHKFRIESGAPYQAENASLSVLALKMLRDTRPEFSDITADMVYHGIRGTRWPARMEELAPHVFLDGAHNEDGIRRFTEAARLIAGDAPAVLLFAAVSDKDYRDMIRILAGGLHLKTVFVTAAGGARKTDPEVLAGYFREDGVRDVRIRPDVQEAFPEALQAGLNDYVFICGSLYLAGEVREIMLDDRGGPAEDDSGRKK